MTTYRTQERVIHNEKMYFFTFCISHRQPLFGKVVTGLGGPYWQPTRLGEKAAALMEEIKEKHANINLAEYVIMPNHIHLVITLKGGKKADITRFITYCRSLLERRLSTGLTISAHDSLVEELRTDLAFRTACLNLKVHYAYWPYDRLYVAESSAPYGHNQEKVKADKDFNSRSEHWTV